MMPSTASLSPIPPLFALAAMFALTACPAPAGPTPSPTATAQTDLDGDGASAQDDCDDADFSIHPGAQELCDGVDQDCDLQLDEGQEGRSFYFVDGDGDGYGDPDTVVQACAAPEGHVSTGFDCDDEEADVHPQPNAACIEGVDHDCDGTVDESVPIRFVDADGDGFGDGQQTAPVCGAVAPPGYSDTPDDCDDAEVDTWPGAPELCGDERDNDCDGQVDESIQAWCPDLDLDGFSDCEARVEACESPDGYTPAGDGGGDCDDADPHVHPGAEDACDDGLDTDCDGWECSPLTLVVTQIASATVYPTLDGIDELACNGDLTGDGADDLALGYPFYTNEAYLEAGKIALLPGPLSGQVYDASAELSITAPNLAGHMGQTIAIGDVTGDGRADLVAPVAEVIPPLPEVGGRRQSGAANESPGNIAEPPWADWDVMARLHLFAGPLASPWTLEASAAVLVKEVPRDAYGARLDIRGDLNGDGMGDLATSAAYGPHDLLYGRGYLYHGALGGVVEAEEGATATVTSTYRGARLGWSLDSHGDLNGDGYDDLALGSPYEDPEGCGSGAAYVFYGPLDGDMTLADADAVFSRAQAGSHFGYALSTGDVNGDQISDLAITANPERGSCNPTPDPDLSFVAIFLGPIEGELQLQDAHTVIYALDPQQSIGDKVSLGSDLDGDGLADLIIVSPFDSQGGEWAGAAYLLYGPPPAGEIGLNRLDAKVISTTPTVRFGLDFGEQCDLAGDETDDLVILSAVDSTGENQALYIIEGGERLQR